MRHGSIGPIEIIGLLATGAILGAAGLAISLDIAGFGCGLAYLRDWQTLIAGIIALLAAVVALRPAYGQMRAAAKQNLVAARATALDITSGYQLEYEYIDHIISDSSRTLRITIEDNTNYASIIQIFTEIEQHFENLLPAFSRAEMADPRDEALAISRRHFIGQLKLTLNISKSVLYGITDRLSIDPRGVSVDELRRRINSFQSERGELLILGTKFGKLMSAEIARRRSGIKDMEDQIFS
ncbi:hypothetical protein GGQ86_000816 [Xanthobacter flavus]|uniref:Uncharacterized protein n=1 Tax=Xanthobacter flavus TaxID=281 RepID=A0A9W6CLB8_XANFL|nr:hypothetical protein [Xanthobacter flavus]MDR6332369.1 hypothetical protein [Xanthobacter flavus]GLI21882.1 hypothetical protein XFLAVUS301_15560 [Xanthobacter flavus]